MSKNGRRSIHQATKYIQHSLKVPSCIIELCGESKTSSPELLRTLEERFDHAMLQKIVNLDDVAESYGLAEAHVWLHRLNKLD